MRTSPSRAQWSAIAAIATALCTRGASAQERGYALDRFEPSERGSHWFALDSLDFRGHLRPAAGLVVDYAHKPLVIYDANGDERTAVVRDQLFAHLGASIVLLERLRIGASLPIAAYQAGDPGTVGGVAYAPADKASIGDLRVSADVRLVGETRGPFTAAFGVAMFAPTGSPDQYTGEGAVRLLPRIAIAGEIAGLVYSARVSFTHSFSDERFGTLPKANELGFGAAVGVRMLSEKLVIGPEVYGTSVLSSEDTFFTKNTTPFEGILGGHYQAGDFRIGLGGGPGLTRGFGSPKFRLLASFEYAPDIEKPKPKEPSDRDHDGIVDDRDACPDDPGPKTDDPATNGCPAKPPPPSDRDKDGIVDSEDACPDDAGPKTTDPKTNGCPPPPDKDGDGVPDKIDACPDVFGEKTDDPKTNGCPKPVDSDGDGILDPEDACPSEAGPKDPDPKKNGCPKVVIASGQIKIIEQVKFKTNSAEILKESDTILTAVAKVLKDHPEIKRVRVEGHTDNKGAPAYNKDLSNKRAASVVAWLTKNGIAKDRLVSQGFGQEKPIDTNDTDEGRQNNRRVEFHIVEEKK